MINFLQVVLNGYANERKYFLDYLLREQKKAEEEHYQAGEFFSKCFDVVEGFKKDLDRQIFEEKKQIYEVLSYYRREPDNHKEEIENCNTNIKELSRDKFTVNLFSYAGGAFKGHLYYDQVLEIETKISKANEAYNSEINLEDVLKKYKKTPEANLIPPYRLTFLKFDNWDKFLMFLKSSTPRFSYVLNNLSPEDQIRLKNDFYDYLKEIKKAQIESKYKEYLDNYIKLIEEKYQEIKKEVPLYNPEGKRQLYLKSKDAKVIFPYLQLEWKFNDWKKFLNFLDVTRVTYIYIFDRLEYNEQLQLKWDFIDLLQVIKEKQTETKYIKALQGFEAHINNFAGTIGKDEDPKPQQTKPTAENINPYPGIFKDSFSFQLFDRLFHSYKDSTKLLADFSFIYRQMEKENFLVDELPQKMFRAWLSKEPYKIVLGKFKTYDNCTTPDKLTSYNTIKENALREFNVKQ